MRLNKMNNLPTIVISEILIKYLDIVDQKNFFDINKNINKEVKIYYFNNYYSKEFMNNYIFRKNILDKLNTKKRLVLNIRKPIYYLSNNELNNISNVYSLSIIFDYCNDTIGGNVHLLKDIPNLSLVNCRSITDANIFNSAINLNLSGCLINNVSMLGNLYSLNISGCIYINDVSMLGKIHNLNLYNCINIRDVSKLGSVHTLNLSLCPNIRDVSKLGKVHNLNLSGCINIKDFSMLGSVHILNLANTSIRDTSMLGNVYTLNLSGCNIKNVSMLGSVHNLNLLNCPVSDIRMLETVNTLNVSFCSNIKEDDYIYLEKKVKNLIAKSIRLIKKN